MQQFSINNSSDIYLHNIIHNECDQTFVIIENRTTTLTDRLHQLFTCCQSVETALQIPAQNTRYDCAGFLISSILKKD